MIDRLRQMAIFAKAIDHGSFRGAARELRLSPSVVSHHISQLEEHIGVALLYRSTRKLTLTPEGERLLGATRQMLDAAEGEFLALSGEATEPSGELRITVPSVLSQSGFIDALAAFSVSHPKIKLSLDFSDVRRELVEDGYDLAIRIGKGAKTSATSRTLFKIRRQVVASPTYLDDRPVPQNPKEIENWDWLVLAPAQNNQLVFQKPGITKSAIKPDFRASTNDAHALYRLSRAGAGISIVPDFLAKSDIESGRMCEILPDWTLPTIDVFAVWPANAPRHGLVHLALRELTKK